jgi:DNA (cytosine-5)-methyltransferase 1
MERIAKGFKKFVIESKHPYILKEKILPFISTYYGKSGNSENARGQSVNAPLATITAGGLRHGLVTPFISRQNKTPVGHDIEAPIGTITGVNKYALCTPFIAKNYTGVTGSKIDDPLGTVTTVDHNSLVVPFSMAIDHTSSKNSTWSIENPLSTITAKNRHAVVASFLHKYYGTEERQSVENPLHTVTTRDRFGLVEIKGIKYEVYDIGFRMLTPRELYRAQGFPDSYKIEIKMPNGKTLSKSAQVRMCGNSVVPLLAKALVEANYEVENIEEKVSA